MGWTQSSPSNVRCCLDGDATDLGSVMVVKHCPGAWLIAADSTYPSAVRPELVKQGAETPCAKAWIEADPPPAGIQRTPPNSKPQEKGKRGCCCWCTLLFLLHQL